MATAPKAKEPIQENLLAEVDPNVVEHEEVELASDQDVEIELEADEEEIVEDPSIALQKQIEALRKSEDIHKKRAETYRQEAEQAKQATQEKTAEVGRSRKEILQSQFDAISTALAASQSEVESAKRDMRTAAANQDIEAQIEATERLTRAQANITKLEDGKVEIEQRLKVPDPELTAPQKAPVPFHVQQWIKKHPDYLSDPEKNADIQYFHRKVIREGIDIDSEEYLPRMEVLLGLRQTEEEAEVEIPAKPAPKATPQRQAPVSAPVSREAPSSPDGDRGGVIKLTGAQRDAAKIAGVTEKVYAENLAKINKMKANGTYGGQQ